MLTSGADTQLSSVNMCYPSILNLLMLTVLTSLLSVSLLASLNTLNAPSLYHILDPLSSLHLS